MFADRIYLIYNFFVFFCFRSENSGKQKKNYFMFPNFQLFSHNLKNDILEDL